MKKFGLITAAALLIGVILVYRSTRLDSEFRSVSMDHSRSLLSSIGPWTITQEKSHWGGSRFCRAVGSFTSRVEMTILRLASPDSYRDGQWYVERTDNQLKLPEKTQVPVEVVADGKAILIGELLDVGNWTGDNRTAWYARFEFSKAESLISAIREGKSLTIRGDHSLFMPFQLLIGTDVISELDRCISLKAQT